MKTLIMIIAFYLRVKKVVEKYFKNLSIVYPDQELSLFEDKSSKTKLTLRGISYLKKGKFLSLMKDSVKSISLLPVIKV